MSNPPPLPSMGRNLVETRARLTVWLLIAAGGLMAVLLLLRATGMVVPYKIPTGGMTPAVSAGDHILTEGFTFWARGPRRGEVATFRTDGVAGLPEGQVFAQRIAGMPGEQLEIRDGVLYINGRSITLSNALGAMRYPPSRPGVPPPTTLMTIPEGHYFMLGDNSTNSYDSRFWGVLPGKKIRARVFFCYWPPSRVGVVQ